MEYYSETKRNTFLIQCHKDESPGNILNRINISSPQKKKKGNGNINDLDMLIIWKNEQMNEHFKI